jgi:PhnB protein
MALNFKQDGYFTVTPTLIADDADGLIDFMMRVFGATERMRMDMPNGKIAHAEYMIGDSPIMVADASDVYPAGPGFLHLYVEDADRVYNGAIAAGATSVKEPENHFYGDRSGTFKDAWGNRWTVSTHVEDVTDEDVAKRMAEMAPG